MAGRVLRLGFERGFAADWISRKMGGRARHATHPLDGCPARAVSKRRKATADPLRQAQGRLSTRGHGDLLGITTWGEAESDLYLMVELENPRLTGEAALKPNKGAFIMGWNRGLGFQTALELKNAAKVVIGSRWRCDEEIACDAECGSNLMNCDRLNSAAQPTPTARDEDGIGVGYDGWLINCDPHKLEELACRYRAPI